MLPEKNFNLLLRFVFCFLMAAVVLSGCSGSYEETLAGVQVPIPRGMAKSPEQGMELALPGFGGAQASYQGGVEPEKVLDFYRKEMPQRGWQSAAGILGNGGMLSYTKEGKAVVVMVGSKEGRTSLNIMVGGVPR